MLLIEYNPVPASWFRNEPKDALFRELQSLYATIELIDKGTGDLHLIENWEALDAVLPEMTWQDLVCRNFRASAG